MGTCVGKNIRLLLKTEVMYSNWILSKERLISILHFDSYSIFFLWSVFLSILLLVHTVIRVVHTLSNMPHTQRTSSCQRNQCCDHGSNPHQQQFMYDIIALLIRNYWHTVQITAYHRDTYTCYNNSIIHKVCIFSTKYFSIFHRVKLYMYSDTIIHKSTVIIFLL